ncbi:hypothetical protein L917_04061 [Phytophthora nicotianae]|uniref:Myb/SANT-like DNA-binding domain-containing protein n=1 Tax=Phytophthora nicotianae TaxID=4792 RepID=W2LQH9_PHYNI|nr:hypothetical protein L917_04061 [Phytophthora nicotianae]
MALVEEADPELNSVEGGPANTRSDVIGAGVSLVREAATRTTAARGPNATWSDDVVEAFFRIRYKRLSSHFKNTKETKRIKYAWSVLASTLSVNRHKVFTDQQCQAEMKNMKQKWTSARAEERQTGNGGPVRRPNHFCIMKDYWGDATGMNNRPHLSTEDTDTIAAAREASGATSLPSSPDSRSRRINIARGSLYQALEAQPR